jgi:hypothetical protein
MNPRTSHGQQTVAYERLLARHPSSQKLSKARPGEGLITQLQLYQTDVI